MLFPRKNVFSVKCLPLSTVFDKYTQSHALKHSNCKVFFGEARKRSLYISHTHTIKTTQIDRAYMNIWRSFVLQIVLDKEKFYYYYSSFLLLQQNSQTWRVENSSRTHSPLAHRSSSKLKLRLRCDWGIKRQWIHKSIGLQRYYRRPSMVPSLCGL